MTTSMNRLSREYVFFPFQTTADLSGATVQVAFLATPTAFPVDADWRLAVLVPEGPSARILVGPAPSDVVLAPGDYQTWIRITAGFRTGRSTPAVIRIQVR